MRYIKTPPRRDALTGHELEVIAECEKTLVIIKAEHKYFKALRESYDGDNKKIHKMLREKVEELLKELKNLTIT